MIQDQLISVVVIVYNSSKYILETLDSIKRQTYQNLELIISDDCSFDSTVSICRTWVNENKYRFTRVKLIEASENTGISANCNRGYKAVRGEWVKMIAGDDILLENCINSNLEYALVHKCHVLFSKIRCFKSVDGINQVLDIRPNVFEEHFFDYSPKEQFELLLESNIIPCTPSAFLRTQTVKLLGYTDERFPFVEDYPLWVRFTQRGFHLDYFPVVTVLYRLEESITRNKSAFINERYLYSLERFYKEILFPLYPMKKIVLKYSLMIYFFKMKIAVVIFKNKKTFISMTCIKLFSLLDPFWYKSKFKKYK